MRLPNAHAENHLTASKATEQQTSPGGGESRHAVTTQQAGVAFQLLSLEAWFGWWSPMALVGLGDRASGG
jgi:hypothetical protein